ncbi:hypothetical protein AB1Y20_011425 [Prymnesium parvum]|uniref:Uncharacterized protein n=1 Tax=Prymnesium parvum TaxID=97485 RepID=A0AB34INV5_PRYPA
MSLREALLGATHGAIDRYDLERARMLLALAHRADRAAEASHVHSRLLSLAPPPASSVLSPLVDVWRERMPSRLYEAHAAPLAAHTPAYLSAPPAAAADAEEGPLDQPYPQWAEPSSASVDALLGSSLFHADAEEARRAHAAAEGLLPAHARGSSSCDLLAALVQLSLAAPFSPLAADLPLLALLGGLHLATTPPDRRAQPAAPVQWDAVSRLDAAALRRALADGLADEYFYEPSRRAARAWRRGRARRLLRLLRALRERTGGCSLGWLRQMPTWQALQSLLRLPAVSAHAAAALLLFELRRPLFPLCVNALEEAKALGWVPPHASADAAFLHLHARLPRDGAVRRAVYTCLCRHSVFRLTRRNVTGVDGGERVDVPPAVRERRGQLVLQLLLRSAAPAEEGGAEEQAEEQAEAEEEAEEAAEEAEEKVKGEREEEEERLAARRELWRECDGLVVVPSVEACAADGVPLRVQLEECMQWHQLYPETGATPLAVHLRALDAAAASAAVEALVERRLPFQSERADDGWLSFEVTVSWSHAQMLSCARLLGAHDDPAAAEEGEAAWEAPAAAGPLLFGFGGACENALHLLAKCDAAAALESLWRRAGGGELTPAQTQPRRFPPLDARGRSALHAAALAGSCRAAACLLSLRAAADAADCRGDSPLHLACGAARAEVSALLLEAAPHAVELRNLEGSAPLEAAAGAGAAECVALLLRARACVDGTSRRRRTALHAAARGGHLEVCRRLVEHGCDPLLKDLSERRASEMLPAAAMEEGRWLVELTRDALKRRKQRPSNPADAEARAAAQTPAFGHDW